MSLKARSTQSSQSHWEKAKSSSLALVTTCSRENQKNVIRAKHCMCPYHSFIWHFSLSQTQNSKGKEQGWQFSSVTQSCLTLHDPIDYSSQASLPISNSLSLLKLMSIESIMLCNRLILCRLLLLLPSIFPSIRIFSNDSVLHIRWPKHWNFSISPCNEYSGLISFRMDWFDLLTVQGTLKTFLQHHSSKKSILWCSAFFTVQLSHPYTTTEKTIDLTRQTFVSKVMSLFFNMLSRS